MSHLAAYRGRRDWSSWPMRLSSVSPFSNQVESQALRVSRCRVRPRISPSGSTALPVVIIGRRVRVASGSGSGGVCTALLPCRGGRSGVARAAGATSVRLFGRRKWQSGRKMKLEGKSVGRKSLAGRRGLTRRVSALKNRAPGERHYRDSTQTSAIRSFLLPKHAYHPGALDRSTKSVRYGAIPVPKPRLPKK